MTNAKSVLLWLVPTLARIVLGFVFWLEGTQKIFGWWSGSPTGSGHPEPFLSWPYWWAGIVEVVIGSALVVGLRTRLFAVLGAGTMAYAYFFVALPEQWDWEPLENGGAFAAVYCWAFLLLACSTETHWSADQLLRRARESVGLSSDTQVRTQV